MEGLSGTRENWDIAKNAQTQQRMECHQSVNIILTKLKENNFKVIETAVATKTNHCD